MEKAKQAVSGFMAKAGHHDTTVHERVAPAVERETVKPTRHEHVQTAVDKEIHQDHYHTSIQPVHDKQVLPEKHTHQMGEVEHRHIEHGNERDVSSRLQQEAAQFKNESTRHATTETKSVNPTVAGEHIHHHVHETIQPVVHKQTIEPHVVHTTVPVHEVHHKAAQHHSASALPAVSMGDFKKQGGSLTGREERYDAFEGEPRSIGKAMGSSEQHSHGLGSNTNGQHTTATGVHNGTQNGMHNTHNGHAGHHGTDGAIGRDMNGVTGGNGVRNTTHDSHDSTHKKASLMDKINPKVDSNGDGKAGFMK